MTDPTRIRCLVVEDEPAILRLLNVILQDLGCDTLAALDAEAARELVERENPDVVITDVRLPGMSGLDLAHWIKSDPQRAATPVLLMSAYGEPHGHEGDDFLPKPFDVDGLTEFVTPYISRLSR